MTEAERKALIQKNLRASKLKWKDLSADIVERVMQGTRGILSPNYKFKSAINETETEKLGRHIYDGFPDDFKKNPTDEALDRLLGEIQADIVPKWEKGLDWDSLTGKFAPNKQFELAKAVSSSKSNEQPTGALGKWLQEYQSNRANVPGQYDRNQAAKYDSLKEFNVPSSNRENIMLPPTKKDIAKPSEAFQINPMPANFGYKGRTLEGAPGKSYFGQQALTDYWNARDNYNTKRGSSVPFSPNMQGLEVNYSFDRDGLDFYGQSYMGGDAIQQAQRDMGVGYNPEDNIRDNLRFDLG